MTAGRHPAILTSGTQTCQRRTRDVQRRLARRDTLRARSEAAAASRGVVLVRGDRDVMDRRAVDRDAMTKALP
jgi:hypothetical protein